MSFPNKFIPRDWRWTRLSAAFAMAVHACCASAQQPTPADVQQVLVTAAHPDFEEKKYQDLQDAVTLFDKYHAEHPDAVLRFRLLERKEGGIFSALAVYLLDTETGDRTRLDVDSEHRFVLPSVSAEVRKHALIRTNMPDGTLAWSIDVRRAGSDERHRLMGDLREQCHLDLYGANLLRAYKPPMYFVLKAASNICMDTTAIIPFYAAEPLFAVHVKESGKPTESLLSDDLYGGSLTPPFMFALFDWPYQLRDQTYRPPISDKNWSDDAVVEFVYVSDPPQAQDKEGE